MKIRLLEKNDVAKYKNLRLEALKTNPEAFASSYEEEKEFKLADFENRLNNPHSFTFGAFEKEELCGVVTLQMEQKVKLKHRISIFAMYVSVKKRGNGIAKNLINEAIKISKQSVDIEQIYLTVGFSNQSAKMLYKSLGFETYGVDRRSLKMNNTYYDEELMVLYL